MNKFESNIINIYGNNGKAWLADLPNIISKIANDWRLSDLKPVDIQNYSYVLSGLKDDCPIILKLGLDIEGLNREASALLAFESFGAVRIIDYYDGALLLERAVSGVSLKTYFPDHDLKAIKIASAVIKKLHQAPLPVNKFPNVNDWLIALDTEWDIPYTYLNKARILKTQLLATANNTVLLHGDLHHENILQHYDAWLVIDPKGVIGENAYEVAAFIRNPIPELLTALNLKDLINARIVKFAELLDIDKQRIEEWCFVQAVLSWTWTLEDKGNIEYFKNLSEILHINS